MIIPLRRRVPTIQCPCCGADTGIEPQTKGERMTPELRALRERMRRAGIPTTWVEWWTGSEAQEVGEKQMMPRVPLKPDRPRWSDDVPLLHIIAQACWHDTAFIAGNRKGLEELRDAIGKALEMPQVTQRAEVCCNDGEGYVVAVRHESEGEMDLMPLGYTDYELCGEPDIGWPEWMMVE